jgi:hypothetical protein
MTGVFISSASLGGFAGSDKDPKLHSADENLVTEVRAKSSDLPKKIPIPE